ncbi:Fe(3+) ions import ATP-binding protein FbpC 2 [Marinomonas aquimarina]|uniref:Fe(3+) ions import ATP-binding protein FbpC 2 n=1 Tax=Marinomonas aquimarina TaxID=295068 RepID=A0A1A8T6C4_9GAMM|nr:ATP-binding cassette domain-containing protein [Marinomonas aquimarina]SBS27223.1 Fe(3+) ions import ATP-binding protein FbpC 2 [Marinomonas aquimarina]
MLELVDLQIVRQQQPLIAPITASVAAGQILALMGPSGVGKSSLLAYLSGTLTPELEGRGKAVLNGNSLAHLPPEQRHLGLLQQHPLLFPHMTVAENLLFAMPKGGSNQQRYHTAQQHLQDIGLQGLEARLPEQLSGGQQARLALMRTLVAKPAALLLDEPFSKLDKTLRQDMRQLVKDAIEQAHIPAILVTHDEEDAQELASKIIQLQAI